MRSKYDTFWRSLIPDLVVTVDQAAEGNIARLDVSDIRRSGERASWYGLVTVTAGRMSSSHMAHAKALGQLIIDEGVTEGWPRREFRFSISPTCQLTVTSRSTSSLDPVPASTTRSQHLSQTTSALSSSVATDAPMDPVLACFRVHELMTLLPEHTSPGHVTFQNGLYFFFEAGEWSEHGRQGRIVRVGNHPRRQDRLIGRLGEHYRTTRDAKNGSVFRRYVGGSLLRRANPSHSCLQPFPGAGHWEHGDQSACDMCAPIENDVTEYLASRLRFRAVHIDEQRLRNDLERKLIATLAACPVCTPSPEWLGMSCYQPEVVTSGLWNQQHTNGSLLTEAELKSFESRVRDTAPKPNRLSSPSRRDDLSDALLIIPCSSSKKGAEIPTLSLRRAADLLPGDMARLLEDGRRLAFECVKVTRDDRSLPEPALAVYTGQPYSTPGFRELLVTALDRGLHCLIVSGGYGLLRPEEPIARYSAHLPTQTRSVWARRLRLLLPAYVKHNQVKRVFTSVSRSYASCLPRGFALEEWWGVPTFDRGRDEGSPYQVVPERVGRMATDLLAENFAPGEGWSRLAR